jgi:hypothetical protein
MIDVVHFDEAGEIMQVSRSNAPAPFNGWRVGQVVCCDPQTVSHVTHKVDLARILLHDDPTPCVFLVVKSEAEQRAARRPLVIDLRVARNLELAATDGLFVADRQLSNSERVAWLDYRLALRQLGRWETIEQWLAHWPLRPDGRDAVAQWSEHEVKS